MLTSWREAKHSMKLHIEPIIQQKPRAVSKKQPEVIYYNR